MNQQVQQQPEERPNWSQGFLKQQDLGRIEESVRQAELKTNGEIVPMVVRGSSVRGHIGQFLLCFLLLTFVLVDTFLYEHYEWTAPTWMLALELFVIFVGAHVLSRLDFFLRLLTSKHDLDHQVHMRAEVEFFEGGLDKTDGNTGVLLFVSLAERRAVVLADKGIAKICPPETWNEVVGLLTQGIKSHGLGTAFENAVSQCAKILEHRFPATAGHKNQLSDRLQIKD